MPLLCCFIVFVMDAVELISSALLGIDQEAVFIGGKVYHIYPPTVRGFVGAARYLKEGQGESIKDVILNTDGEGLTKALSWLINGDESLAETFMDAPLTEVQEGVIKGLSLLDPGNFMRLSALLRNVRSLIAKPRS